MLTRFRNRILEKENLRFADVIRLAQMAVPEVWHNREFRYFNDEEAEINDNAEGGRGTKPISQQEGIVCYLAAYAKWHKSKLHLAFDRIQINDLCQGEVNIVDWGCGQGLATLVLLDYLDDNGVSYNVKSITLIEPSPLAIGFAQLYLSQRLKGKDVVINVVNKLFDDLVESDFSSIPNYPTFHLYSNILDVAGIDMKGLSSWLKCFKSQDNYIISVSPKYGPGDIRINTFLGYLDQAQLLCSLDESDKLKQGFTYNIRVAKLLADAQQRIKEFTYYIHRQFFAAYILDSITKIKDELAAYSAFDVSAPYEIGTSYRDDVDPIYAVLSNMISRGLPTKASPFLEESLAKVFKNSERKDVYGTISYLNSLSDEYVDKLWADIKDGRITHESSLILTPIAVAKIQKTIVEALITGHLTIDQESWDVLIDENDVPCGALAIYELQEMMSNLCRLTSSFDDRRLPKINLTIINRQYSDSALHLNAKVYDTEDKVRDSVYDLVIDYSSFAIKEKEYDFKKYRVKTDCYYAIFLSSTITAQRYIYTTDLIEYKSLSSTDNTGQFVDDLKNIGYLEYFLQLLFRKQSFRLGQVPILDRALRNKSVIGLLPTGGGKSLTYQLAALLQPGVTIIIDPLKSLMEDQYYGLHSNGIDCCTFINNSISREERDRREYMIERSQCMFAFMSPERLCIYSFRKRLQNMHDLNVYFSYGVIDEVHCVSEWGQDFRFSYLHLGRNLYNYVRAKKGVVTLFGLTATASFDVLADVERELSGHGSYTLDSDALVRCEDTNRLELQYRIIPVPIEFDVDRYFKGDIPDDIDGPYNIKYSSTEHGKNSVLNDLIEQIPSMVRELQETQNIERIARGFYERQSKSYVEGSEDILLVDFDDDSFYGKESYSSAGIVFCPHRTTTDVSVDVCAKEISKDIRDTAIFYAIDEEERFGNSSIDPMQNMADFRDNKLAIMVATKAFGMGIDKPNVRFTINVNYSNSLEAYVQEAGRAGRDRSMALSIILVSDYDLARLKPYIRTEDNFLKSIKGKWFKTDDLKRLLQNYPINWNEHIDYCNPSTDLVSLQCDKKVKAAFKKEGCFMDCECELRQKCKLPELKQKYPGWCTYNELMTGARELSCSLVGRNYLYSSPDYQHMMYFFGEAYPGLLEEKKTMLLLMSQLEVSTFIGDTVEINRSEITNRKGFLDLVLSQEPGTEVVVIVRYAGLSDTSLSKAIYRMCCIGFIDDFTKDYAKNQYRIVCVRKEDGEYFQCLKEFLMRYYPEDKAEKELQIAKGMKGENEVHKCLAYLTDFIYEKLAVKKKRAIDDIRAFCNVGLNKDKDWKEVNEDLKDYIYYYFNSKFAKEDYVAENGEPYSLTVDTDYGKEAPLDLVFKYFKVVDDEICGSSGNPNDNIKHLQGAVRLIMRSLTRDNPVIDLLNVYCILVLGEYRRNTVIKDTLESCYSNAYRTLWDEFSDKQKFYSYISSVKEEMFKHGADKSFEEVMDLIEMDTIVGKYNNFLQNLNWKINS